MSFYSNENFYSHTFTPREYQVELLESAKRRNTVVCSSTDAAKSFIIVKLLQEYSWKMKKALKKTLLLLDDENLSIIGPQIKLITDLNVVTLVIKNNIEKENWNNALCVNEIVLVNEGSCRKLLRLNLMELKKFELIIIDDCLYGDRQIVIQELMELYEKIEEKPRILGFSASLLGLDLRSEYLEAELLRLENLLDSRVDTSSEIVTLIRLSCRPKEYIVECTRSSVEELDSLISREVNNVLNFLKEHRFDPSEIYEAELLDELKQAPNPVDEPINLLEILLSILTDMGPWSAQQAALAMVSKIEKLKIKVPYERHFLLLCMVSTVLVKIYAICDDYTKELSDTEKILNFSTSKVLRYLEILKKFKPNIEKPEPETHPEQTKEIEVNSRIRKGGRVPRRLFVQKNQSEDSICCLTFVNDRYRAKVLFNMLCTMSQNHDDYFWISTQYAVEKTADPAKEMKEAEQEHKQHEEVLRKYRAHEVNIMISTFVLEYGCDLPKCNLVIRFDLPQMFHSYIQSKARARASYAHFISLVNEDNTMDFIGKLSQYNEIERILLKRCCSLEPDKEEEYYSDCFSNLCQSYQPSQDEGAPSVTLSNAVTLINKYCAKLPSDTFTKLTPIWDEERTQDGHLCRIRLPINSPVKETILSPPMPNGLLARRAAAFMACQLLHKTGELDDNLQPIGKENFVANEEEWNSFPLDEEDEELARENVEPRPGTTKRRQYYYKKVAEALLGCHPIPGKRSYFYKIVMTLSCPLPEEQNTRGRKIYPPEDFPQSFGILTSKKIPKISSFPIFTRSGEVSVELELCSSNIILTKEQILKLREFLNYTFTRVLRLQKYLMLFNPDASLNSYLVVPTSTNSLNNTVIDWKFVELINKNLTILPKIVPEEERKYS